MHVPYPHHPAPSLWTSVCCRGWSPGPPLSPPLALTAGMGFSFWKERDEVSISNFHCHPGPIEPSLSWAASTLGAGTAPKVLAQCSGEFCRWSGPPHAATASLDRGCQILTLLTSLASHSPSHGRSALPPLSRLSIPPLSQALYRGLWTDKEGGEAGSLTLASTFSPSTESHLLGLLS